MDRTTQESGVTGLRSKLARILAMHPRKCILLAGLVLHLGVFLGLPGHLRINISPDYQDYYLPAAKRMLAGQGYTDKTGQFIARYPPVFPLLVAGTIQVGRTTGVSERTSLDVMIALCGIASALLLFETGLLLFSFPASLAAALLWLTYPFYLYLAKQPNPESPFIVFLLAAVYAWARGLVDRCRMSVWVWPFLAGSAAGLATLTRPISLLLPALLAMLLIWNGGRALWRRRLVAATVLVASSVAVLVPWEIAAKRNTGEWILVSSNSSYSTFDGLTFALEPKGSGELLEVDPEVHVLMQDVWENRHSLPTTGSMLQFVADRFADEPWAVTKLLLLKARRAWYATQAQWYENVSAAVQIPYLLLILLGIYEGFRRPPSPAARTYLAMAVLTTLYMWAMTLLVLPILRYMVPAVALLMLPAAAVVTRRIFRIA